MRKKESTWRSDFKKGEDWKFFNNDLTTFDILAALQEMRASADSAGGSFFTR